MGGSLDSIRARKVTVYISGRKIKEVKDPAQSRPWDPNTSFPAGEHFGWDLAKYEKLGIDVDKLLTQDAAVAPNHCDDKKHCNTLKFRGRELIMLDCGHWGAYHAKREKSTPQRDFGMIENGHVWLCRFDGNKKVSGTLDMLKQTGCKKAEKLVRRLEATVAGCSFGVELVKHTAVCDNKFCKKLERDRLYIILPDLHLPERWPDLPRPHQRYGGDTKYGPSLEIRKLLLETFVYCQHQPGLIYNNRLDSKDQQKIQDHLEAIWKNAKTDKPLDRIPLKELPSTPVYNIRRGAARLRVLPRDFVAEKRIVDRYLKSRATWFTAPMDNCGGDPRPAIDLVNFLVELREIQKSEGKTTVVQVGDMYELWMNREFLYRFHKIQETTSPPARPVRIAGNRKALAEEFQYRMDRNWRDASNAPHPIKRYIFNAWKDKDARYRHLLGGRTARIAGRDKKERAERLERVRSLLKDRTDNIYDFCLPMPTKLAAFKRMKQVLPGFDGYVRRGWKDREGNQEAYWNRMIIDLLADELRFKPLYGNHDGYRGDRHLNSKIAAKHKCRRGWISENGIWFEHSHRWDEYNRDGISFGAAVTNYVFYYRASLTTGAVPVLRNLFVPERQQSLMPGAVLWYTLVNFKKDFKNITGKSVPAGVKPFGIFVIGHTHHADLARLRFDTTTWHDIKKGAKESWQSVSNFPSQLMRKSRDEIYRNVLRGYLYY